MFQHALYEKQRWWWDIISAVIYFIVQEMGWVFDERERWREETGWSFPGLKRWRAARTAGGKYYKHICRNPQRNILIKIKLVFKLAVRAKKITQAWLHLIYSLTTSKSDKTPPDLQNWLNSSFSSGGCGEWARKKGKMNSLLFYFSHRSVPAVVPVLCLII